MTRSETMSTLMAFFGAVLLQFASAQSPGDTLTMYFDDASDDLQLDSIYPAGCWQVGAPMKPVFSSASTPANALVTDTILPYPENTTCYAEFTLIATDANHLGRSILYRQRRDMDTSTSAWVEVKGPWGGPWHKYGVEWDELAYVDGIGLIQTGDGYEWTGVSSVWEEIWLESPCFGVLWDPNGNTAEWYSDTMKLRFVFQAQGNPLALDGWMIDDVRAGVSMCTGSVQEGARDPISMFPDPADHQVIIKWKRGSSAIFSVMRMDGSILLESRMNTQEKVLDVSSWPSGTYVLRVQSDGSWQTRRFCVIH